MWLTQYDEARTMSLFREEGREDGLEEGINKTRISSIRNLMTRLQMTAEKAMDILDIPPEEHEKYALILKEADPAKTTMPKTENECPE